MTPRELHARITQLWPDSSSNEHLAARLAVIEETAVSRDYAKFAEWAMDILYYAGSRPGNDCKCPSCELAKVLKEFARGYIEPSPVYATEAAPVDFGAWHTQMEAAGWTPVVDLFGVVLRYQKERPAGKICAVLPAYEFARWAEAGRTPPPF